MVNETPAPATRSWPDRIAASANLIVALVCGSIGALFLAMVLPELDQPPKSIGEGEGQMISFAAGVLGVGVSAYCLLVFASFVRHWRIRWWLQALPVPVAAWARWETRMPSCCNCGRSCDADTPWGWLALAGVAIALLAHGIRGWRRQVRNKRTDLDPPQAS